MVEFHSVDPVNLGQFLERRRANRPFALEMSLAENLTAILRKANEFVPSEAGSLLLDNPEKKGTDRAKNSLTFIATFGEKSDLVVGREIAADRGIAGHVYTSGKSYRSDDVANDDFFDPVLDSQTDYRTDSLVAIPVRIEQEVCGVLELVNRKKKQSFSLHDLNLLEIFAGYISISIQNVLDGRHAHEIAKRDNLTGLFNDRYLHIALSHAIGRCRKENSDLTLLFLDLDFFKRVNDAHGHLAGSQVLREVGQLLGNLTDECTGAIAARYGGDEFVVAIPDMDMAAGVDLAETLRNAIESATFCKEPGDIQPDPLFLTGITSSVGIATLHRHIAEDLTLEQSKSTLLRLSDAAMYVSKETGRNRTAIAGEPVRRRVARPD